MFLVYLYNGKLVTCSSISLLFFFTFIFFLVTYKKENLLFLKTLVLEARKHIFALDIKFTVRAFFGGPIGLIKLLVLILVSYAFIRGIFFPISQWDDLVRYAAWGNQIFARGEISKHINSYPLLVPLIYTYGFLSSGFRNDYLIKLIPLTFGFLNLVLVYLMANDFFKNKRHCGLISVFFTLSFVPFFDWFHLGYVDIASSFYFVGSFYLFYLFSKTKSKAYLFLCGIFVGLSLWSKQQTLTIYVSVFITSIVLLINGKKPILDSNLSVSIKDLFTIIIVSLFIILPWYIRDFLILGVPIQIPLFPSNPTMPNILTPFLSNIDSISYYSASFFQVALLFSVYYLFKPAKQGVLFQRKTLRVLAIILMSFVFFPRFLQGHNYLPGIVTLYSRITFLLGLFIFCSSFFFPQNVNFRLRTVPLLVLLWISPFYFIWWLKFSMVFRYLLTIIPLFSILFVFAYNEVYPILKRRLQISIVSNLLVLFLICGFVFTRLTDALTFKGLENLFTDRNTRLFNAVGETLTVGNFLNTFPEDSKPFSVVANDNRLAYFAPQINFYNITPSYLSDLVNFDYFILDFWTKEAYDLRKKGEKEVYWNLVNENPRVFQKVYEEGHYKIFKVLVKTSDFELEHGLPQKNGLKKTILQQKFSLANWHTWPGMLKNKWVALGDQIFYNRPKEISMIANNRLVEVEEFCRNENKCGLAENPLEDFSGALKILHGKVVAEDRLLVDENFYIMLEISKNFVSWTKVLSLISAENFSISKRAGEILKEDLVTLIDDYKLYVLRHEPKFSYFDKNGVFIDKSGTDTKK